MENSLYLDCNQEQKNSESYFEKLMKIRVLKTLIVLLLVTSSVWAGESQSVTPRDQARVSVGEIITGHATEEEMYRAIRIVQVQEVTGRYIFFTISQEMENSMINMAIFRNDEQKPLTTCSSSNVDTCYIDSSFVRSGDALIAAIKCTQECSYTFETYWSDIETLIPNEITKFSFFGIKSQLYHLNLENSPFQEARIIMLPQSKRTPGDSIKIYGNYGYDKTPTQDSHDFQSQNLWKDGQGIFLTKDDFKGEKKLSILVTGQSNTIYHINAETIETDNIEIPLRTKKYEYIEQFRQKKYRINLQGDDVNSIDEYSIHFAKFSGDMDISFFTDSQMTKAFATRHFEYMNDIKYIILKAETQQKKITELYIKITTLSAGAVFQAIYDSSPFNGAVQINSGIYDFLPVHKQKIAYLHYEKLADPQGRNNQLQEIDVNIIRVIGEIKVSFRVCTSANLDVCLSPQNYTLASRQLPFVDKTAIGKKFSFKLKISQIDFQMLNQLEHSAVILILVENNEKFPSLVAIDYSIGNDIHDLRTGHPIEEMIDTDQRKYYKFVNSDPNVKAVKIHTSPIRGSLSVMGSRSDPRVNNQKNSLISAIGNTLVFDQNLNEPIYVIVQGLTPSILGLTVQLSHKQAEHSLMSLSEGVEYTLRIPPGRSQLVRLHPIFDELHFQYQGSSSVSICILDENGECSNENKRPTVGKKGQINMEQKKNSTSNVLIGNPSEGVFVEVKVIYRSSNQGSCQEKTMENLYTENVQHNQCYSFPLKQQPEEISFMVERNDIGPFGVDVYVCQQLVTTAANLPRFTIPAQEIQQKCLGKTINEKDVALIFKGDQAKPNQKMKVQFSGLYKHSIITLADGIAFQSNSYSTQGKLSTFYYHVINILKTTVVLRSSRGSFKFYVKIIDAKNRQNTKVSPENYDYSSESGNFFKNPCLSLNPPDFVNSDCDQCGILIAVYSVNDVGGMIEYSMEVVQNSFVLKDDQSYQNHIPEGSVAFYEYEAHKDSCNLIVEVSDHNTNCAQIFLSDKEYPSEDNFLVKEMGSKLTYQNCSKKIYFIGVVAIKDCAYSLSVSNSPYSITRILRGKPNNIKLKQGEVKYVMFRHITPSSFKLATLHKFGSVDIYANVLDIDHLTKLKQGQHLDYKTFQFKSSYTDVLVIQPTEKGFCSDCYYIAAIVGKRQTESSLLLADDETSIEIASGKVLNDQISEKDGETKINFKKILTGILPFQVHSGSIRVVLKYKNESATYEFSKKKEIQMFQFKLNSDGDFYDYDPIRVSIVCITPNCSYCVGLVDTSSEQPKTSIVPGVPSFTYLDSKESQCIKGFIRDKEDDIIVTIDRENAKLMDKIQLTLWVNGEETTKFIRTSILNVMRVSINFEELKLEATTSYKICLKLTQDELQMAAIIEQGEDINLLAEDSEVVIRDEDTFLVYPEGPFLVDIFECIGKTTFNHGYESDQLDTELADFSSIAIADQPHALRIDSYLPTFLKVKSALSVIRWISISEVEQRGQGYFKYKTGNFHYETGEKDIKIQWDSLAKSNQTNTTVKNINYKLFISDNMENLKSASSCEQFQNEDVIVIDVQVPSKQQIDSKFDYIIQKTTIGQKFSGRTSNIFMNLVADMTLSPPNFDKDPANAPEEEYYRFLYHSQQIPKDVFADHDGDILDKPLMLALIGIGVVAFLLLISYIMLKKIVPLLSRMRNSDMVEEDVADKPEVQNDKVMQSNERIVVDQV